MIAKRLIPGVMIGVALATAGACDTKGLSYGDPNSIIVVMSPDRWDEVSEDLYAALERTVVTVRDEKTFTVTYQQPYAEYWGALRRFNQMLLVGTLSDAWIADALAEAEEPIAEPGVHQVRDVWARGQTVTVVLLSAGDGADELRPYLASVNELLDKQYQNYTRNRMYFSGIDSALADTLNIAAGFHMLLPRVYTWHSVDSTFVFRNDNPDPSELIRQIAVTWISPAAAGLGVEETLAWRARLVEEYYSEPQDVVLERMVTDATPFRGHEALELQAQWRNPPDRGWPAGGPLITRAVTCDSQDRTYLIDSWLYAPAKEKYEYMIQLETILDTFRCG